MPDVTCVHCGAKTHTDYAGELVQGIAMPRRKGLNGLIAKRNLHQWICPHCVAAIQLGHVGQTSLLTVGPGDAGA